MDYVLCEKGNTACIDLYNPPGCNCGVAYVDAGGNTARYLAIQEFLHAEKYKVGDKLLDLLGNLLYSR